MPEFDRLLVSVSGGNISDDDFAKEKHSVGLTICIGLPFMGTSQSKIDTAIYRYCKYFIVPSLMLIEY